MKLIIKGKEPKEWVEYKLTAGVEFSAEPELKKALLIEQGYICCYCMCRIDFYHMRVEHYIARTKDRSKIFEYSNLLAACDGNLAEDRNCDVKKDNNPISINPTDKINNCENIIHYQAIDGSIICIEPYLNDISTILNLNDTKIKRNRKSVLDGAVEALNKIHYVKGQPWSKSALQKIITEYQSKDKEGMYKVYCQIVVYYMTKKNGEGGIIT